MFTDGGFGLDIEFIDHLNTRILITLNYGATVDLHSTRQVFSKLPVSSLVVAW
jgi:hypothetical protein